MVVGLLILRLLSTSWKGSGGVDIYRVSFSIRNRSHPLTGVEPPECALRDEHIQVESTTG